MTPEINDLLVQLIAALILALVGSEWVGMSKLKSNSLIQLLVAGIKKALGK